MTGQQPSYEQFGIPKPPIQLWLTGHEYLVWCNGQYELYDASAKDEAQAAATKLAHRHQSEAFIFAPMLRVAPKRDVDISEIKL